MTDAIQHFSSANPASFDIKDVLEESGSGLTLTFGVDLYIAVLPSEPDNAVCIYDTGGPGPDVYGQETPAIQVRIRNLDYLTGFGLARDIKYYLHNRTAFTQNSTKYIQIRARSDILYLGRDDLNRYEWTVNFLCSRSGI